MIHPDQIKPDMLVVCSEGSQFDTVDQMENTNYLKLKKDEVGQHHYIPLTWVKSTENGKVMLDRPANEAMREWSTVSPTF
jgi:hypothetical protein